MQQYLKPVSFVFILAFLSSSSYAQQTTTVISVVDGDTSKISNGGKEESIRLEGMDTVNSKKRIYKESSLVTKDTKSEEKNNQNKDFNMITEPSRYIIAFVVSVFTVLLTILVNNLIQNRKAKILELKKYSILLQSTKDEISFYQGKLIQLSGEIDNLINALQKGNECIIPSYSLYPNFLEKCKIEINSFFLSSELVKKVGECYFELCHISERLNQQKNRIISSPADKFTIKNLEGLKTLIDKNIDRFSKLNSYLGKEIIERGFVKES